MSAALAASCPSTSRHLAASLCLSAGFANELVARHASHFGGVGQQGPPSASACGRGQSVPASGSCSEARGRRTWHAGTGWRVGSGGGGGGGGCLIPPAVPPLRVLCGAGTTTPILVTLVLEYRGGPQAAYCFLLCSNSASSPASSATLTLTGINRTINICTRQVCPCSRLYNQSGK